MRIKQISVNGLFGIFDHVIPLNMDDRITVIHGPNGFGKTAMLTILNGFFNSQYSKLRTIPFRKFCIEFDNGSNIEIIKNTDISEEIEDNFVINFHDSDLHITNFKPKRRPDIENIPLGILDNFILGLERIGPRKWLYTPTQENLSLEEVLERFGDSLGIKFKSEEEPEWFEKLKNNIHIRLIESQRLLNFVPNLGFKSDDKISSMLSTVSTYSYELAKLMQDKFKESPVIIF